jgi:cyclophilin family peptidyl-prolyl cis-trans isomerase
MQKVINIVLIIAIIVVAGSFIIKPKKQEPTPSPSPELQKVTDTKESPMPAASAKSVEKPKMMINQKKSYSVVLHTSDGDITIDLDVQNTPKTANNFYYLAKQGFYNNVIFHRVIKGFMIQGGDPTGTGSGGPGYQFEDEYLKGDYTRGTVAMANAGPNTNGSQFFIMHADNQLPNLYVIFGHVSKGMDVVDKIAESPTVPGGEGSRPVTPVVIQSTDIIVK